MNPFENAPIISSYSRKQAIEDGVLVDLMQPGTVALIKNAGIQYPVAMTATAFAEIWPINGEDPKRPPRGDMRGRLWDVLTIYKMTARKTRGDTMQFRVSLAGRVVTFKAVIGPGDTPEPVITIMLPGED